MVEIYKPLVKYLLTLEATDTGSRHSSIAVYRRTSDIRSVRSQINSEIQQKGGGVKLRGITSGNGNTTYPQDHEEASDATQTADLSFQELGETIIAIQSGKQIETSESGFKPSAVFLVGLEPLDGGEAQFETIFRRTTNQETVKREIEKCIASGKGGVRLKSLELSDEHTTFPSTSEEDRCASLRATGSFELISRAIVDLRMDSRRRAGRFNYN